MATQAERVAKAFDRHVDSMKPRSLKWTFRGGSRLGDRRIKKFMEYYFLPVKPEEVLAFLDTTVFKTGKEGYLFTTSGIIIKEVINKLYYLEFEKIEGAEVEEKVDEAYNVTTTVWVHFKDGTKKQIFDYYINKYSFVAYINDIVAPHKDPEIIFED